MSEHRVTLRWIKEAEEEFSYQSYHREHDWEFDNGVTIRASAAPDFLGSEECVDPEEAFVASISSCHMLTFLAICAKKKLIVSHYADSAVGFLEKNAQGRLAVTRVRLQPVVTFEGDAPEAAEIDKLHEQAHKACFIANSVNTEITIA